MATSRVLLALGGVLSGARAYDVDGCTSIIVSSGATKDGSAMTSHSDDCTDCDWRVAYVPARDHAPGSMRKVGDGSWGQYPRTIDPERSEIYTPGAGMDSLKVVGSIPQVPHTYALWEGSYSLMNEHGLAMGESTTAAWLAGKRPDENGTNLLAIRTLMELGLERCDTARCAVQTMGDLASQYGFYGEDPGLDGAGEVLNIVDKKGEAWVFHVMGGVPAKPGVADRYAGQRGCLWAAQRVPDGHIAVVANLFIIKEMDVSDPDNFMAHPGLFDLAHEAGLWDGKEIFNFQKMMMPDPRTDGAKPIPMYGTLRTWGTLRQAAPSVDWPITDSIYVFPFSVKVDEKVDQHDVFQWFRNSYYEGTELDMTKGVLAGPFSSPNRVEGGAGMAKFGGQFTRAISIHRTSYVQVAQSGIAQPVVWFAADKASTSVFVPFFASALRADGGAGKYDMEMYGQGSQKDFDFTGGIGPAWWAFDFVANWMDLCYKNMSETYVYPAVHKVQGEVDARVLRALGEASAADSESEASAILAEAQTGIQRHVGKTWWALAGKLVVRYNDGNFNYPEHAPTTVGSVGYPAWWLEMIGFNNDSWKQSWVQPAANPPSLLVAQEETIIITKTLSASPKAAFEMSPSGSHITMSKEVLLCGFASVVAVVSMATAIGFRLGARAGRRIVDVESAYHKFVQ